MAIASRTTRSLLTWRDIASGGAHGIVTHGLDAPHYVEVERGGAWALLTLDATDKPVFVERGNARNVAKAKRTAEGVVQSLVAGETPDNQATKTSKVSGALPWVRTVKIYFGLSLTVLAMLIFARWLLLYRPGWFGRILVWGGSSLFIAHRIIVWFVEVAKRVDYLTGRKATAPAPPVKAKQQPMTQQPMTQQPMTMPVLASSKRKALPSGKGRRR